MTRIAGLALLPLALASAVAAQPAAPSTPPAVLAGPGGLDDPPPVADPPAPPPSAPSDHAADGVYDPAAMAAARLALQQEHGGMAYSRALADILEYRAGHHGGGYRWAAEAWFGGDLNRVVVKSEGEGGAALETGEVQALYARAVGPYADLQAGLRQDVTPARRRTYATVGVESLAPYGIAFNAALFLSTRGDLLVRAEGSQDFRMTQRLILQPRVELNFAARDARDAGVAAGLSEAALDLRLRYEVRREFAPYVGVTFERRFGKPAPGDRADDRSRRSASVIAGIRAWF